MDTQNTVAIQKHQDLILLSKNLEDKLEAEEKKMWQMQFSKPVFGKYGEVELIVQVQVLCVKISIITGWALPNNETLLDVFYDQFSKKLKEDYYSLNADEVEYAFRKWGTTTEDWGKSFNLNLVDKVLIKYLNYRSDLRDFVNRSEPPSALPSPTNLNQTDEDFIEENYLMWCNLKNKFYQYINHVVYDRICALGLISLAENDKVRIRAAVKFDLNDGVKNSDFNILKERLINIQENRGDVFISRLCKKYAVAEFFNKLIEHGKTKVFES